MGEQRRQFTLSDLMAMVFVVGFFGALAVAVAPPTRAERRSAKKRDCVNNLRQLGAYLKMYASRYGRDRDYPPAAGLGFWDTLRTVPTRQTAVTQDDGLFVCKLNGRARSPTACDYRCPVGRIAEGITPGSQPIACDRTTNHNVDGDDDINVLYFDGTVRAARRGSPEWQAAMQYTQDR